MPSDHVEQSSSARQRDGEQIKALLHADRTAGFAQGLHSLFRGAPSHSGAYLLQALRAAGWELQRTSETAAFIGDAAHPDWTAYVAANLFAALELAPDTGDWHAALKTWCEAHRGDVTPNPWPLPRNITEADSSSVCPDGPFGI